MSKQTETTPPNDVAIMRDILMGGHIAQYEVQFAQLDATIAKMNTDIHQRIQQMEDGFNQRLDKLEQMMVAKTDDLQRQIKNVSKQDKTNLSDLLAELSQKVKAD